MEDKPSYRFYHRCRDRTVYSLWLHGYGIYSANPFSRLGEAKIRTPLTGSGSYCGPAVNLNLGGSILLFWSDLGAETGVL